MLYYVYVQDIHNITAIKEVENMDKKDNNNFYNCIYN